MVAVLSYLHFAFVSEPSALAGLIARAASEAERGGGFHILEVTMTEASSGVAFELPNGTRTVWEAPDTAPAADSRRPGLVRQVKDHAKSSEILRIQEVAQAQQYIGRYIE